MQASWGALGGPPIAPTCTCTSVLFSRTSPRAPSLASSSPHPTPEGRSRQSEVGQCGGPRPLLPLAQLCPLLVASHSLLRSERQKTPLSLLLSESEEGTGMAEKQGSSWTTSGRGPAQRRCRQGLGAGLRESACSSALAEAGAPTAQAGATSPLATRPHAAGEGAPEKGPAGAERGCWPRRCLQASDRRLPGGAWGTGPQPQLNAHLGSDGGLAKSPMLACSLCARGRSCQAGTVVGRGLGSCGRGQKLVHLSAWRPEPTPSLLLEPCLGGKVGSLGQGLGWGQARWRPRGGGELAGGSSLTQVEQELTPALPVHVVDEAAGERLEEQAEDGHARAEAPRVREAGSRVEDADVDDVQEDGDHQATQKLQDRPSARPRGDHMSSGFMSPLPTATPHHTLLAPPPGIPDRKLPGCPAGSSGLAGKQLKPAGRTPWMRCPTGDGGAGGAGGRDVGPRVGPACWLWYGPLPSLLILEVKMKHKTWVQNLPDGRSLAICLHLYHQRDPCSAILRGHCCAHRHPGLSGCQEALLWSSPADWVHSDLTRWGSSLFTGPSSHIPP